MNCPLQSRDIGEAVIKRKGITAISLAFFALLLLCTIMVPVVQAGEPGFVSSPTMTPIEQKIPSNPPPVLVISEEIKQASPRWYLLAADAEGQQNFLNDLKEGPISDDEKNRISEGLQKIWAKYPVTVVKTNETSYLTFISSDPVMLTEDENNILAHADDIRAEYLNAKNQNETIDAAATLAPVTTKSPLMTVLFLVAIAIASLAFASVFKKR